MPIIDFFHAAEHLWAAAGARYGPGTDPAKHWAKKLCGLLEAGDIDEVLAALRKAGANPVLWLRCARLSAWFDDYWNERLQEAA